MTAAERRGDGDVEEAATASDTRETAAVGRRQGLISLAAATMTFAGMSLGEADALEADDCLECHGAGVVACACLKTQQAHRIRRMCRPCV